MFLTALVAVALATPQTRPPFQPQLASPNIVARLLAQPGLPASFTINVTPPVPAAPYSVTATLQNPLLTNGYTIWTATIPSGAFAPPAARRIAVITPNEGTIPVPSCRIAFLPGAGLADLGGGRIVLNSTTPYSAGPAFLNATSVTSGYTFTVGP